MRTVLTTVLVFVAAVAFAAVIWDESVDGDLSNDRTAPTDIALISSSDEVLGTVGGAQGDEFTDAMRFVVPVGKTVTAIELTNYVAAGGNTTSGFNVYTGTPVDPAAFGDICSLAVGPPDVGTNLLTLCTFTTLTEGTYTLAMLEGTPDQQYHLTFGSDVPVELQSFSIE